jgi:putative hydrolase of the HAD superfamily
MDYSILFFDLDGTLYPNSNGLWQAIRERMAEFMRERLEFPPDEIPELSRSYFEKYGTTLRGLQINHSVDSDEYLAYVHDLALEEFISPDPELHDLLISLPQRKWIFTNADQNHAERVISILGITGCFEGIIDVRALDFLCKPDFEAYQRALALVNGNDPGICVLFDDSPRNLVPAHRIGFTTVLVGSQDEHPAADYSVQELVDLPHVFPQLWPERV